MMKKFGLLAALLFSGFALYCLGYYKGVNDASFLLSTTRALIETGTINYINQGKYEKAKQLNLSHLESSIAAMEDIYALNGRLTVIPRRVLLYKDVFPVSQEVMKERLNNAKPKYEKLKITAKPSQEDAPDPKAVR